VDQSLVIQLATTSKTITTREKENRTARPITSPGVVAHFCRSSLPRRTSRIAATCVHVNQSSRPISWHLLHTKFALRRKSFPAERTCLNNQSRLHPTSPGVVAHFCRSCLPGRTSRLAATSVHEFVTQANSPEKTSDLNKVETQHLRTLFRTSSSAPQHADLGPNPI
jgi:hypothetical protein